MKYDFDSLINRRGTDCYKWNVGENELPMWIADMDMKTDPFVAEALRMRLDRDVLGYTSIPAEFYDVIHAWQKRYHGFDLDREWIGYAPGVITAITLISGVDYFVASKHILKKFV